MELQRYSACWCFWQPLEHQTTSTFDSKLRSVNVFFGSACTPMGGRWLEARRHRNDKPGLVAVNGGVVSECSVNLHNFAHLGLDDDQTWVTWWCRWNDPKWRNVGTASMMWPGAPLTAHHARGLWGVFRSCFKPWSLWPCDQNDRCCMMLWYLSYCVQYIVLVVDVAWLSRFIEVEEIWYILIAWNCLDSTLFQQRADLYMPGKLQDNHNETWKTRWTPHHLAHLAILNHGPACHV